MDKSQKITYYGETYSIEEYNALSLQESLRRFLAFDQEEKNKELINSFEPTKDRVLIRFFQSPGKVSTLEDAKGERYIRDSTVFPFGVVLKDSSENQDQKFVYVGVDDVALVESSAYRAWVANNEKTNNEAVLASKPPQFESNLQNRFGRSRILLNPFDEHDAVNTLVYSLPKGVLLAEQTVKL